MAELRGLGDVHAALKKKNGSLYAVSVDTPANGKKVVDEQSLDFGVLSDRDRKLLGMLNLVHDDGGPGGTPVAIPSHLLIAKDGSLAWSYVSKKIVERPDPAEIIAAIDALK